ncbi:MAG: hypothetical protein HY544_01105 [Candidatus Diapherotrites archaeon]|uniref:Uncharacterized protein n=1 Tax=Candidatus Iainarchaeum sp. TaxID=3101447 RepID=A0A8T3YK85_9ARCH|nr:hypothetical protein [Candidatus Diapherotrites archaeon]
MGVVTVFLYVLIAALVIGNALLFFVRNRLPAAEPLSVNQAAPVLAVPQDGAVPSLKPLEFKVELAHRRIQELERSFAALKASGGHLDTSVLRKLEKLDSFKSTAEAELVAMKEIITELQNGGGHMKASGSVDSGKGSISETELRRLIYRSSSP